MSDLIVLTGAEGFLGSTIVRQLRAAGREVLAGVHDMRAARLLPADVPQVISDVTRPRDLDRLLGDRGPVTLIHTAGLISIANSPDARLWSTNVGGTSQVLAAARRHGVRRLVYVSSVHALAELAPGSLVRETREFSPDAVIGAYAKTKAEATRRVLAASGLDRVVVHPSGMVGPGDPGRGHVTEVLRSLVAGKLPACIGGAHDFVDVRDVAAAIIVAADRTVDGAVDGAANGDTYLLSGAEVPAAAMVSWAAAALRRNPPPKLPLVIARLAAEAAAPWYWATKTTPAFTRYSLHTLTAGQRYDHAKATRELGFRPRPFGETLDDTLADLVARAA